MVGRADNPYFEYPTCFPLRLISKAFDYWFILAENQNPGRDAPGHLLRGEADWQLLDQAG